MGQYERKTFRVFWGLWFAALMGGIFLFGSLWYDRALWLVFFAAEIWGWARRSGDDTLSEFAQWIDSWAKPGTPWNRSWSALAFGMVAACAYHAGYVASFGYWGTDAAQRIPFFWGLTLTTYGPNMLLGLIITAILGCFLFWHFIHSEKHN